MATNLYEYYTEQGKALPTVQDRQPLATQAGISGYSGTAEQNTQLLDYLKKGSTQANPSLTDLQSAQNINIPPQPQSAFTGLGGTGYVDSMSQANTQAKDAGDAYLQNLQGIGTLDTSNIMPELEEKYGLAGKEAEARKLQAQINQNVAEAQAQIVAQGGRQASMGAISGTQADIERKLAIRNLPLTAQYQAAQGDFQAAQDTVNKLYTAKVEDATNQYNYKLNLIKSAYEVADAREKRELEKVALAEERKYKAEQDTINFEREKEMAKYSSDLSMDRARQESQLNINEAQAKATGGTNMTAAQSLAYGYATRMTEADSIINQLGSKFTGAENYLTQNLPNIAKSPERQQYEQAQRNFVNAVLRRESGAAIAPSEFESAQKQYFPQPGDSPQVIAQKAANRQTSINNLYRDAGQSAQTAPIQSTPLVLSPTTNSILSKYGITIK